MFAFTGLCLLSRAALETLNSWSASIGIRRIDGLYYAYIDGTHLTTKLSYVCQYHSKSLNGLSLSVYHSISQLID